MDNRAKNFSENVPLVSILMGVYQSDAGIPLLMRSVQSILQQTFEDFEFLICDTGSSENVCNLLDTFARQDPRVKLIRHEGKITLPEKLNLCMRSSRGRLIARQDDDDISLPQRLQEQVDFLEEHQDVGFVGCNVWLENNDQIVGERKFPIQPEVKDFRIRQPYCHPTLVFRRKILGEIPYSESKWCILCEDYDLLLRLHEAGIVGVNLQQNLFGYHISDCGPQKRKMKHRLNETVTRWKHFRKLGLMPGYIPYAIKPLAVGIMPKGFVKLFRRENAQYKGRGPTKIKR